MATSLWFWVCFNAFVLAMLALDLGVFHRHAHVVSTREAAAWTAVWGGLALLFAGSVWAYAGDQPALQFLTGYLVEEALSADNVFVIATVCTYFAVPPRYQHRVLFWGIVGALVMRGLFIAVGAALIHRFAWTLYGFGAILLVTGVRLALRREDSSDLASNAAVRLLRRMLPVSAAYDGGRFVTREGGRLVATPLFIVLAVIEMTDVAFAVDSIPAVFSVTRDPFVVYTSNIFAVLGLRSLYFLLADAIDRFHLLKYGLAVILVFIGAKMLLADVVRIPITVSLGVVVSVLSGTIALSLARPAGGGRRRVA